MKTIERTREDRNIRRVNGLSQIAHAHSIVDSLDALAFALKELDREGLARVSGLLELSGTQLETVTDDLERCRLFMEVMAGHVSHPDLKSLN